MEIIGKRLAELAGVTEAGIYNAWKKGKLIRGKHKTYDLNHPVNRQWCLRKKIDIDEINKVKDKPKKRGKGKKKGSAGNKGIKKKGADNGETGAESENEPDSEIEDLYNIPTLVLDLRVREMMTKYKDFANMKLIADVIDKLLSAEKKSVDIRARRLELIEKDIVSIAIFNYLETFQQQFFDSLESQTDQEYSLFKSNKNPDAAKLAIIERRKNVTAKLVRQTKKNITKAMSNLKSKYDNSDEEN